MSDRLSLTLWNAQQGHASLRSAWEWIKPRVMAGQRLIVDVKPETRSLAQNSRLWAMLTDISRQVDWYGRKLSPEDWKHVFSASLKKQDVVPGVDGGFVVLGTSTSRMTKREMCDLQDLMTAFGAERGVKFTAHIDPETGEIA